MAVATPDRTAYAARVPKFCCVVLRDKHLDRQRASDLKLEENVRGSSVEWQPGVRGRNREPRSEPRDQQTAVAGACPGQLEMLVCTNAPRAQSLQTVCFGAGRFGPYVAAAGHSWEALYTMLPTGHRFICFAQLENEQIVWQFMFERARQPRKWPVTKRFTT
jgi:hypothetical protein